jgi:hypothetical protein
MPLRWPQWNDLQTITFFMNIGASVETKLWFCLINLRGCKVGITDRRGL